MYKKLSQTADRIEAVLRDRRAPASVVGGKVLPGFVEMLLRMVYEYTAIPHPKKAP